MSLTNAVLSLFALVVAHNLFVGPNQPINCLDKAMSRLSASQSPQIYDVFDQLGLYRLRLHNDIFSRSSCTDHNATSDSGTPLEKLTFWSRTSDIGKRNGVCTEQMRQRRDLSDRVYLFSKEKGSLLLPAIARESKNISLVNIEISANECFGGPAGSWLVKNIAGEDIVVNNWFLSSFGGEGYLLNARTLDMYDLNFRSRRATTSNAVKESGDWGRVAEIVQSSSTSTKQSIVGKISAKLGILGTTIFIFFTTSTLVSFTLRETQTRMLKFTHMLQDRFRRDEPYGRLIFTHVIESLVFVPIMMGMHFFLVAMFGDGVFAFAILSVVWLSETFSVICVRSRATVAYFPKYFFLYFLFFHLYYFSFPFGFSSMALLSTVLFIQHAMYVFWNQYELPALLHGEVTAMCPRASWAHDDLSTIGNGPSPFGTPERANRLRTRSMDNPRASSSQEIGQRRRTVTAASVRTHDISSNRTERSTRDGIFDADYFNRSSSNEIVGDDESSLERLQRLSEERLDASVELSRKIQQREIAAMFQGGGRRASQTLSHQYGHRSVRGRMNQPLPQNATRPSGNLSDGGGEGSRNSHPRRDIRHFQNFQDPRGPVPFPPVPRENIDRSRETLDPSPSHRRSQSRNSTDFPLFGVNLNDYDS